MEADEILHLQVPKPKLERLPSPNENHKFSGLPTVTVIYLQYIICFTAAEELDIVPQLQSTKPVVEKMIKRQNRKHSWSTVSTSLRAKLVPQKNSSKLF